MNITLKVIIYYQILQLILALSFDKLLRPKSLRPLFIKIYSVIRPAIGSDSASGKTERNIKDNGSISATIR